MTPKQPRISIVTPSYNQAAFLRDTIESVLSQGYSNLEYIVLDGGSDDGSVDIIREYEDQINFWRSHPDEGQSAALVEGFAQADGDIFAWVNSDDCIAPGALALVADAWISHGPDVIVAGGCRMVGGKAADAIHFPSFQSKFNEPGTLPVEEILDLARHWFPGEFFYQPEVFFPAARYRAIGGLDPSMYFTMDYDLWVRFALAGTPIVVLDEVLAQFRWHDAQKTTAKQDVFEEGIATANRYLMSALNPLQGTVSRRLIRSNKASRYGLYRSWFKLVARLVDSGRR